MKPTVDWIRELIDKDQLWRFYKTKEWIGLKEKVLRDNHYECRLCKDRGIVTRYDEGTDGRRKRITTVHHVNEVRKHPELALSRWYFDRQGRRHENLIPVCKKCHNRVHDRIFRNNGSGFRNQERW